MKMNFVILLYLKQNLTSSYLLQFKDFLVQYNKLSELCFNDCVHDFTSRTLRSNEVIFLNNNEINALFKYLIWFRFRVVTKHLIDELICCLTDKYLSNIPSFKAKDTGKVID